MFVIIVITLVTLISLGVDTYVYRRWMSKRIKSPWLKAAYIGHVVVLYVLLLGTLLFYRRQSGTETSFVYLMMWMVFIFMLAVVPKTVWAVISFIDYPVEKRIGRHCNTFAYIGMVAGIAVGVLMIVGATYGRNAIAIKRIIIESDKLPKRFHRYKIVHIADLHIGTAPEGMVKEVVRLVNKQNADMVINSGDLINIQSRELTPELAISLGNIQVFDRVVMVLGNHDVGTYVFSDKNLTPRESYDELVGKVRGMGWYLLQNESFYIRRGNDSIGIAGLGFPREALHNGLRIDYIDCDIDKAMSGLSDKTFNIVAQHTPASWEEVLETGKADLALAGHVHSMQFKLRLGGWQWSPARFLYKHWSGLYEKGGKYLYVNDGLGCVMYPMRIGVRPEITIVELRKKH